MKSKGKKPVSIKAGKSDNNICSSTDNKPSRATIVTQQLNSDFDKLLYDQSQEAHDQNGIMVSATVIQKQAAKKGGPTLKLHHQKIDEM